MLNFDSEEQDLGTLEVVVVVGWKEIKAGDLKTRILELSPPQILGVRRGEESIFVADCMSVCSKSKQVN